MSNNACKSQSGNSETTSFVHNDSDSSSNNNNDDDDDDGSKNENKDLNNDSIPFGATATVAESTAATATSTSTSAATASGTKRPMTSASSGEELGLASSRNRKRSDHGAPRKQKLKPLRPDGCMLNPRHPIKIFATDRDKTTRRKLRRFLNQQRNNNHNRNDNDNDNDNDNTEAMYRNHWSVDHCWTFREMLGFDRFSGLRTQSRTDLLGTGTETEAGAGTIIDLDATTVGSEITRTQPRPPGSGRSVGIGIDWIFVTTYVLDVDYLLNELPELLEIPTVVVVYQYKDLDGGANEEAWIREVSRKKGHNLFFLERNPRNSPRSQSNPLGVRMAYGCHHTKMTLVGYSSGRLRVHVHTSNLRREDVHDKCQGAFLQDFLPKNDDQLSNFVTSDFEESLVTYLESYHFVLPMVWWKRNPSSDTNTLCGEHEHEHDYFEATATTLVAHLQTYDFSTAVGVLIPSVPGYHRASLGGRSDEVYGYLKVQRAIQEHCNNNNNNNNNSSRSSSNNKYNKPLAGPGAIVCQFSSMGAVWEPYLDKIAAAWNADATKGTSATVTVTTKPKPKKGKLAASRLRLVWPTTREITESVEGPAGGASVPGTAKNLHKPFLRPLLHKWRSGASDRTGEKKQANKMNKEITTESSFRCYREYDPLDKGHHVPHIKTYYQMCEREPDPDRDDKNNNMLWFVLSSHNLSVAAWGQIQNRSTHFGREVLTVQHWELGVFVAPSTLGVDAMGPVSTAHHHHHHHQRGSSTAEHAKPTRAIIPLPYQFRPDRYEDSDQPWVVR